MAVIAVVSAPDVIRVSFDQTPDRVIAACFVFPSTHLHHDVDAIPTHEQSWSASGLFSSRPGEPEGLKDGLAKLVSLWERVTDFLRYGNQWRKWKKSGAIR